MSLEVAMYDYDPAWKEQFRAEKKKLKKIFGRNAKEIQHVGSTAVKDLPSRQEIDIQVQVKNLAEADCCTESLRETGYEPAETEISHCRHYVKSAPEPRVSLYLFGPDGQAEAEKMLNIRDYLAVQPDVKKVYSDLKWQLAADYGESDESYLAAKQVFWSGILPNAMQLSQAQGKMSMSMSIGMLFGLAVGLGLGQAWGNASAGMIVGMLGGLCAGALYAQRKATK